MGYPMAGTLARAGHDVTVYNRSSAKAAKWVETYGGRSAPTPAAAAKGAEIVHDVRRQRRRRARVADGETVRSRA
jgi:3-hydroxyisobutyrate dehydrogenase-like beta-hydroxyacid dehydrogenase